MTRTILFLKNAIACFVSTRPILTNSHICIGVYISDIAYAFAAIILLPINSAMNPFLYSDVVDIIWKKLSPVRKWFGGRVTQRSRSISTGKEV